MNKDKILETITTIGTIEDEVERRELLSQLSETVTELYDSTEKANATAEKYTAENEKLREYNNKLFLRIGEQRTPEEIKKSSTGVKEDKQEPRRFEELFNEKGDLK